MVYSQSLHYLLFMFGLLCVAFCSNGCHGQPDIKILDLDVGVDSACVLLSNGAVACWGNNRCGQLGRGFKEASDFSPRTVIGISDAIDVDMFGRSVCAVRTNGQVWCWGYDPEWLLGRQPRDSLHCNYVADKYTPQLSTQLASAAQISVENRQMCLIDQQRKIQCNESYGSGRLSDFIQLSLPVHHIKVGNDCVCASHSQGLHCWESLNRTRPQSLKILPKPPRHFDLFDHWVCAANEDGAVVCTYTKKLKESEYWNIEWMKPNLQGVFNKITLGPSNGCAISDQGALWCWSHPLNPKQDKVEAIEILPSGVSNAVIQEHYVYAVINDADIVALPMTKKFSLNLLSNTTPLFSLDQFLQEPALPASEQPMTQSESKHKPLGWYTRDDGDLCLNMCNNDRTETTCLERPKPPCGLSLSDKNCKIMANCGQNGVCWYGQCLATQTQEQRAAISDCFSSIASIDYFGASADRLYHYNLHMDMSFEQRSNYLNQNQSMASLNANNLQWADDQIECQGENFHQCYSYHRDLGSIFWNEFGISGSGDSSVVSYLLRDKDTDKGLSFWKSAESIDLSWGVEWPFGADDPARFPSHIKVVVWGEQDAKGCRDEVVYETHLKAEATKQTLLPRRSRVCLMPAWNFLD